MSLHRFMFRLLAVLFALAAPVLACAQRTAPVVMVSDIHFDPFHNPHLLPQLRTAPIERWPEILNTAPSLAEDADRAALEIECHSRALDTPWPLLKQAMVAAHDAQPNPLFVTLSGDLLTHQFPCRFNKLAPDATAAQLSAFSAKTVAFVLMELREAFPRVPVYAALGNNDSGCADYHQTPESPFQQSSEHSIETEMLPQLAGRAEGHTRYRPDLQVSPVGDYSVALPQPLRNGRLIVLDDIYDAFAYRTCAATVDHSPEETQIAWLRGQLEQARSRHEQVWVMGHIPPGIDVYASFAKYILHPTEVCSAQPQPFLADNQLADTLLDFADVIRLAIFAHTHMDEIRVLHRASAPGTAGPGTEGVAIPVKLVPSVTPYFGNHPAFLVAQVETRTLVLQDWETIVSPDPQGSTPPWTEAYRYSTAYDLPDFSAKSALELAQGFADDRTGRQPRSHTYRDHFYAGDAGLYALGLEQVWPAYACSVREDNIGSFRQCLCPAAATPPADAGSK